jgi:precorrin-6Y C5,15-methyltransferase (decarboxylating)
MNTGDTISTSPRILILGMSAGGTTSLPTGLLARIAAADLLVGGRRHLGYFPDFGGERLTIETDMEAVARRLQQGLDGGEQAIVLASGDPLCYGIGATLRRFFPAEALEIIPAASAFQLAFAALAEPWTDAALLSAHARPLAEVVHGVKTAALAAVLTDDQNSPAAVTRALLEAGLSAGNPCAICENLGSSEQRVVRTTLAKVDQEAYAPLNVFVVWNEGFGRNPLPTGSEATGPGPGSMETAYPPGLPDEAFATSAGQMTKREIRLLSLVELALGPGEVMWDVGTGSGTMAIEAARAQPSATIYAVEKRAEFCEHVRENLQRFPVSNVLLTHGVAPAAMAEWPGPDAVFVGGSGGQLEAIIDTARDRLRAGGRLVINLATLENLSTVRKMLPQSKVIQVQISRGVSILNMLRFEALNPVFIVRWKK